ncbi:amino acid transporter [Elysia marginata]|uniref:Amino acid transporter n=1 Tax=Elysia marginata TaxID=1093978 RepID=A0AAV4F3M9_9GAST|nr:amino acid transporter [Elysia marginata]
METSVSAVSQTFNPQTSVPQTSVPHQQTSLTGTDCLPKNNMPEFEVMPNEPEKSRKKSMGRQILMDNLLIILIVIAVFIGVGMGVGLRGVWEYDDYQKIWYLEVRTRSVCVI